MSSKKYNQGDQLVLPKVNWQESWAVAWDMVIQVWLRLALALVMGKEVLPC